MTVLLVAAQHPDLVHAVIALYPVSDLLDLDGDTHRFESGYTLRLVGPLPDAADTYRDRSPITHASEIRAPVLLLHGEQRHVGARRAVGGDGSRRCAARACPSSATCTRAKVTAGAAPTTIADDLERIDAFLTRWVLPR